MHLFLWFSPLWRGDCANDLLVRPWDASVNVGCLRRFPWHACQSFSADKGLKNRPVEKGSNDLPGENRSRALPGSRPDRLRGQARHEPGAAVSFRERPTFNL